MEGPFSTGPIVYNMSHNAALLISVLAASDLRLREVLK
jgi:hypothetical protein